MSKGKKKRVNPRRVPIAKGSVDTHKIVEELSVGNLYYAWLLVLPELFSMDGMDKQRIFALWETVNEYAASPRFERESVNFQVRRAEKLIGYPMPHKEIRFPDAKTKGELDACKRKMRENALYSALCIICLGLESTGQFTDDQIRKVFFNAGITLAEVRSGLQSFDALLKDAEEHGVIVEDNGYEEVSFSSR